MVQSGDPKPEDTTPEQPSDHDDDLIGFASPRALEGRPRAVAQEPEREPEPEPGAPPAPEDPDLFDEPAQVIRPSWGATAPRSELEPEPEPVEVVEPEPEPVRATPSWMEQARAPAPEPAPYREPEPAADPRLDFDAPAAPETAPEPASRWSPAEARRPAPRPVPALEEAEGQGGLFALYALILLIVPTLGVAGAIGLFAVLGRAEPTQPLARSHHIFQKRTLIIAAGVAVAGVFLMAAPFALGVISLFGVAVWVIVRGAFGLWRLKAGRPISNPRGLWI